MKATIDVPDELYRSVKAQSAMLGQTVREVTIELYRRWLGEERAAPPIKSAEQWLDEWIELGGSMPVPRPGAPTATDILTEDRNRLKPR